MQTGLSWDGGSCGSARIRECRGLRLTKPECVAEGAQPRFTHLHSPCAGRKRKVLPFRGRQISPLIDGTEKVAFPSDSRWYSKNKSIFCNMVASARPKERFIVGPVPVWLSASEDGQVITERSRWLGGQRGRGLWKASCSRTHQE